MNLIHQLKQIPDLRGTRGNAIRSGNYCSSPCSGVYAAMLAIAPYQRFAGKIGVNSKLC